MELEENWKAKQSRNTERKRDRGKVGGRKREREKMGEENGEMDRTATEGWDGRGWEENRAKVVEFKQRRNRGREREEGRKREQSRAREMSRKRAGSRGRGEVEGHVEEGEK